MIGKEVRGTERIVIETRFTGRLGIDLPIVQAGMSWASSCAALPAAVSRAGGLGVVAAGPMRVADLAHTLDEITGLTDRPFAVNLPLYRPNADELMALLLERRIPVLIASQGGPARYVRGFQDAGTVCLHVVASKTHAVKAAEAGVDGLIVVGGEAGGHPPQALVSTLVNVRAVARAVGDLPIVASGGFADGAGLAAALALGASAAQFGTRFMATEEANLHPDYKRMVVEATTESTRTVGHGLGLIRALRNEFTDRMEALERSGRPIEERRASFNASTLRMAASLGDMAQGKVEAGQAAGLVHDILPAGEIVRRIAREYIDVVARMPRAH